MPNENLSLQRKVNFTQRLVIKIEFITFTFYNIYIANQFDTIFYTTVAEAGVKYLCNSAGRPLPLGIFRHFAWK